MKKSTSKISTSKHNQRLKALLKNNLALIGEIADAKVCNQVAVDLYNLRLQSGLTQKELAERLGVKQSNISRWEQPGYQGYKVKMLSKISRILGGRMTIRIAPQTDSYFACMAYRKTERNHIEATSPDGWQFKLTNDTCHEWIVVKTGGSGANTREQGALFNAHN